VLTRHGRVILNEQAVAEFIAEEAALAGVEPMELVSTDDNLRLEYSTPKANADHSLSADALAESLEKWWEGRLEMKVPDEAARDHVMGAWLVGRGRFSEALPLLERASASRAEARPLLEWVQKRAESGH
jgi:hypothetical protein